MRNFRRFFVLVLAITIFALMPARANALPKSWEGCRTVTKSGITYRIRKADRAAVVVRVHKSKAAIPGTVKVCGTTYRVRCILDGALRGVKSLTIRGSLRDGCEDGRLWRIKVWATNGNVRKWLRATGANVTRDASK